VETDEEAEDLKSQKMILINWISALKADELGQDIHILQGSQIHIFLILVFLEIRITLIYVNPKRRSNTWSLYPILF